MIVTIMQPAYLPWPGYFHRVAMSDLFIILDHVKIDRNSRTGFAHRNKIRTRDGWCWLSLPLRTRGRRDRLRLDAVEICADQPWAREHWASLRHCYARASGFPRLAARLDEFYHR